MRLGKESWGSEEGEVVVIQTDDLGPEMRDTRVIELRKVNAKGEIFSLVIPGQWVEMLEAKETITDLASSIEDALCLGL